MSSQKRVLLSDPLRCQQYMKPYIRYSLAMLLFSTVMWVAFFYFSIRKLAEHTGSHILMFIVAVVFLLATGVVLILAQSKASRMVESWIEIENGIVRVHGERRTVEITAASSFELEPDVVYVTGSFREKQGQDGRFIQTSGEFQIPRIFEHETYLLSALTTMTLDK